MRKERSIREIDSMTPQERWQRARSKLNGPDNIGIVSTLVQHMRCHENSQWLVYSAHIANQVPRSYAAHAFRELQSTVLHYEVLRLCSFWDPIDLDSRSIPTIAYLADCRAVSKCVYDDHFSAYSKSHLQWAEDCGKKARRRLREGIRSAIQVENSDVLANVRNYRDKLAHQLEKTYREKSAAVPLPRYGDEKRLLTKTIRIVDKLYVSLNGTSYDWNGSKAIHKKNAKAFWKGVTIEVLR